MTYDKIAGMIDDWCNENGRTLRKESNPPHRRFWHIASRNKEVFQIVVEPEQAGRIRVDAHMIESYDGRDADFMWSTPLSDFKSVLRLAENSVRKWSEGDG